MFFKVWDKLEVNLEQRGYVIDEVTDSNEKALGNLADWLINRMIIQTND